MDAESSIVGKTDMIEIIMNSSIKGDKNPYASASQFSRSNQKLQSRESKGSVQSSFGHKTNEV